MQDRIFACHVDLVLKYPRGRATIEQPYRLWFFINQSCWRNGRPAFRFYAACHRGKLALRVRGESYPVVLFDMPSDGDYSNNYLIVDLNRDGKAQASEKFRVGDKISIGQEVYRLESIPSSPAMRCGCGGWVEKTPGAKALRHAQETGIENGELRN